MIEVSLYQDVARYPEKEIRELTTLRATHETVAIISMGWRRLDESERKYGEIRQWCSDNLDSYLIRREDNGWPKRGSFEDRPDWCAHRYVLLVTENPAHILLFKLTFGGT